MEKYFTFEVHVFDDQQQKLRFRSSNFQYTARVTPDICTLPLRLEKGWNKIQINLPELVKKAYGTTFVETICVQLHPNCRLLRIYFSDKLYDETQLPMELKLYQRKTS
jgi:hypothetical protein